MRQRMGCLGRHPTKTILVQKFAGQAWLPVVEVRCQHLGTVAVHEPPPARSTLAYRFERPFLWVHRLFEASARRRRVTARARCVIADRPARPAPSRSDTF